MKGRCAARSRALVQRTGAGALQRKHASRAAVQTRAAVELFQLAGEGAEISTAASVMFAITLVVCCPRLQCMWPPVRLVHSCGL